MYRTRQRSGTWCNHTSLIILSHEMTLYYIREAFTHLFGKDREMEGSCELRLKQTSIYAPVFLHLKNFLEIKYTYREDPVSNSIRVRFVLGVKDNHVSPKVSFSSPCNHNMV